MGRSAIWDSIPGRLAELNETGLIAPGVRFTRSMMDEMDAREKTFDTWCRTATGRGIYFFGFATGELASYYDSLEPNGPPLRDRSKHRVGTVEFKGKRVADAEIIVCSFGETWTKRVFIEHGRLLFPDKEPTRTLSELNGKFDFYPDSEVFQILVFHEVGFGVLSNEECEKNPVITLEPWAEVSGKFVDDEFDEVVHFTTHLQAEGRAQTLVHVWNTPLHADRSFHNPWIPPGKVSVIRSVQSPRASESILHDSLKIEPSGSQEVIIGPMNDEGRMQVSEFLKREKQDK